MFRPYARVIGTPRIAVPLLSSFLGSLPITMLSLGVLLMVQSYSGSFAQAGVVSGVLSAGNGLGLVLQGRLIDRHGQSRVLMITGISCGTALVILTLLVTGDAPFPIQLVLALISGASIPAVITSMRILIPELVSPELRVAGYALLGTQFQVAMITGPLVVSALLLLTGPVYAVLVAAVLATLGGIVFATTPASRQWQPVARQRSDGSGTGRPLDLLTPGLRTLLAANLGAGLVGGLTSVAVPAAALAVGAASIAGLLFAAQSTGDLIGGFIYGGRAWRLPVAYRLICCQAVAAIAIGLLALLSGHPIGMLPVMFGLGLFHAPAGIVSSTLLDEVTRPGTLGLSYTSMVAAGLLGISIGSSAGGVLANANPAWVLLAVAAGIAIAVVGITYTRRRTLVERSRTGSLDSPDTPHGAQQT